MEHGLRKDIYTRKDVYIRYGRYLGPAGRLVALAAAWLVLTGQTGTDVNQYFDGNGVTVIINGWPNFNDCDPMDDEDCQVLNLAGCSNPDWPHDIDLSIELIPPMNCNGTDKRKIWIAENASDCNDTLSTKYLSNPIILNEYDTDTGIANLCGKGSDSYPNEFNPGLGDVQVKTSTFYEHDGQDACSEGGTEKILFLCYALGPDAGGGSELNVVYGWHKFKVDTRPPGPFDDDSITIQEGDGRAKVVWTHPDSDVSAVTVLYREGGSFDGASLDIDSLDVTPCDEWKDGDNGKGDILSVTSSGETTLDELDNNVWYELCVIPRDDMANEGKPSDTYVFIPRPECDFWECAPQDIEGGFCFIATAAYGPGDPLVETLRRFRDHLLLPTMVGRVMVRLYYGLSPVLAAAISRQPALRSGARAALLPVVAGARMALAIQRQTVNTSFGVWLLALLLMLGAVFVIRRCVRRSRVRRS